MLFRSKEAVYDYLAKAQINVRGYTSKVLGSEGEVRSKESSPKSKQYRKIVREMNIVPGEELQMLCKNLLEGNVDEKTKEILIHSFLYIPINIATRYANRGVASDELIQEGNLSLLLCIDDLNARRYSYSEEEVSKKGAMKTCEDIIRDYVRNSIVRYIDGEVEVDGAHSAVLAKASLIHEASKHLATDLGRVASVKELAEYTHLSIDEIEDIVLCAGESISIGDGIDRLEEK